MSTPRNTTGLWIDKALDSTNPDAARIRHALGEPAGYTPPPTLKPESMPLPAELPDGVRKRAMYLIAMGDTEQAQALIAAYIQQANIPASLTTNRPEGDMTDTTNHQEQYHTRPTQPQATRKALDTASQQTPTAEQLRQAAEQLSALLDSLLPEPVESVLRRMPSTLLKNVLYAGAMDDVETARELITTFLHETEGDNQTQEAY